MNKLLSANFSRLKKDKIFWAFLVFMLLLGLYRVCGAVYYFKKYDELKSMESLFFNYTAVIGILTAAFGCLFVGTEQKDGGIRNQLIVGHLRGSIYVANLITVTAAALFMCFAYLVPVSAIGFPILGFFRGPIHIIFICILGSLIMVFAFSALITLLAMLITNKSLAVVIGILSVVAFFVLSIFMDARLSAPEYIEGIVITDNLGDMKKELIENHQYLEGTKRTIFQFIHDFLPTGQAVQYFQVSALHLWQMPLYSLGIGIISTVFGVISFHKKDIN